MTRPLPDDVGRLRAALAAAIAAFPLGLVPGCGSVTKAEPLEVVRGESTDEVQDTEGDAATDDLASASPFVVYHDDVCAMDGRWAMTVGAVRYRLAQQGAVYDPSATVVGCAFGFRTVAPQHDDIGNAAGREVDLWIDEHATMDAREAGAADLCVYRFTDVCEEEYRVVPGRL